MVTELKALALILLSLPAGLSAQEWSSVDAVMVNTALERNRANYGKYNDYTLDYELIYYRNWNDLHPEERSHAVIQRTSQGYRAQQLGIWTVQDAGLRVSIDSIERIVLIAKPNRIPDGTEESLPSDLLATARSIGYRKTADGERFRIEPRAGSEHEVIELVFDQAGWLREMVLLWRYAPDAQDLYAPVASRPKLVLKFDAPRPVRPGSLAGLMSTRPVVRTVNGKVELTDAWKDFELIDTRWP